MAVFSNRRITNMFALFNDTKNFIGYSNVVPPNIQYIKDLGDVDLAENFWDGDYDNGSIKPTSQIKVSEFELEESFIRKVKSLHSSEISHLLCLKQVYIIAEKLNCLEPAYANMYSNIGPLVDFYETMVKSLKESGKFETKEDIYEKYNKILQSP